MTRKKLIALILMSALSVSSCSVTPILSASAQLYVFNRYLREAESIAEETRLRLGADSVVLGVYNEDYTGRIQVAIEGDPAMRRDNIRIDSPSFQEMLEAHKANEIWSTLNPAELSEGPMRSAFMREGVKAFIAVPVYDKDGYLLGYVGASWRSQAPDYFTATQILTDAQSELNRLSGLL